MTIIDDIQATATTDIDAALDVMYDWFDRAMHDGRWEDCATALDIAMRQSWSTDLLVGFLCITNAGKDRLCQRPRFVQFAWEAIAQKKGPEAANELLRGLV